MWGKIASHTCATSRKKKCYTLFAWESLAWFLSPNCNFCRKICLTRLLVPLRLLTLELVKVLTTLGVLENELRNSDHRYHRARGQCWRHLGVLENELRNSDHRNRHERSSHPGSRASRRGCALVPP